MKLKNANAARAKYTKLIWDFVSEELGEDCGMTASNSFNFPIVVGGEEGGIEIVIKVPKEDEVYEKREEYALKLKDKAERDAKRATKKGGHTK